MARTGFHWQNWAGNQYAEPRRVITPRSAEEVAEAVGLAALDGLEEVAEAVGLAARELVRADGTMMTCSASQAPRCPRPPVTRTSSGRWSRC